MAQLKPALKTLYVDQLQRGRYQPRRQFSRDALEELAQSIRSSGLIQPIVVRPIDDQHYEIIAGERRFRAAQIAGQKRVPCLINHYSDEQAAAVSTVENTSRVDLNPIEEATAYQVMIDQFRYRHEEVAAIVGKSRTVITNLLRLLKCDKQVQELLIRGELSEGHGRVIAGLPLAQQAGWGHRCVDEKLSVRQLERDIKVRRMTKSTTRAPLRDPDVISLESEISDYLGCPATISRQGKKWKLDIRCANLEVFEGILARIGFCQNEVNQT